MSNETHYEEVLTEATQVFWALGLTLPPRPIGDDSGFVPPAEAYLEPLQWAAAALREAQQVAFDEIPEHIKFRAQLAGHAVVSAAAALATVEPEIRRFWAVKSAATLIQNLYEALRDEARPQPAATLPKLAKVRRTP